MDLGVRAADRIVLSETSTLDVRPVKNLAAEFPTWALTDYGVFWDQLFDVVAHRPNSPTLSFAMRLVYVAEGEFYFRLTIAVWSRSYWYSCTPMSHGRDDEKEELT